MKNFPLQDTKAYLSGPIEFGSGENWRIEPIKKLKEKFGIDVFDPFSDPKQQWVGPLNEAKKNKDYQELSRIARLFVRKDLSIVDKSDFLIAYLPHKVPTTGTVHEVINKSNSKKPTLLVTDMNDMGCIPAWYFGFIPLEFIFPNWEELFEYLDKVNDMSVSVHNRWDLIRGYL